MYLNVAIYILLILLEFIILISAILYLASGLYSSVKGAPFVPTTKKEISAILDHLKIKKGSHFLEIGCGDGRMCMEAVKRYDVHAVGIDVSPVLIFWARFFAQRKKLSHVTFLVSDVRKVDYRKADTLYIFLMPELVEKIREKIEREAKENLLVISHGFKVPAWEKYRVDELDRKPFPTYFYRLKKNISKSKNHSA